MTTVAEVNDGITTKNFTVKEVFDALVQNGFEHLRETWLNTDDQGKPTGACILGQAGLNLGVYMESGQLYDDLTKFYENFYSSLAQDDPLFEDNEDLLDAASEKWTPFSLETQLNEFDVPSTSPWSVNDLHGAGATIIHWNDKLDYDYSGDKKKMVYALPTYEDVISMARDILSPHFDKIITLAIKEYKWNPSAN